MVRYRPPRTLEHGRDNLYSVIPMRSLMKHWLIAAIVTGIVVFPMMLRKKKVKPIPLPTDLDKRYNIDEFLTEEEL